ncbi:16S rRNA (uracil(1498)-N(3))-methyltransferase [Pelagibacterales bacterium SAG-MED05]|nr:16S rRNA (uracil(1498)-N(3))-methyltransferase [Pelagibacterales bacterium SAG-MED04]MBD1172472.1 16S rRNA (uracil(1498)-N(3))-methyltransferase [Pelagibacterales bacterium SAG-MED05]
MSNIRLYYPNSIVENTTSLLSKEHTHYVVNVMRLKRGSSINFFNKEGEWASEIVFLEKDRVEVKFINREKESIKSSSTELAICLVKKNPMEFILQKATELGVTKIIPIISERTEVKELNFERANKIVIEATEQSNQLNPPEISKITKLKDFINNLNPTNKLFFADINCKKGLKKEDIKNDNLKTILIGPEGDFTPAERKIILENGNTIPFSLSKNILRTETATISALSLVNYSYDL